MMATLTFNISIYMYIHEAFAFFLRYLTLHSRHSPSPLMCLFFLFRNVIMELNFKDIVQICTQILDTFNPVTQAFEEHLDDCLDQVQVLSS